IVIIPFVSYLFYKNKAGNSSKEQETLPKWYSFVPLFVIGFLLFEFLRTIGDMTLASSGVAYGFMDTNLWSTFYTKVIYFVTNYLLGIAMAVVDLSTNFAMFKGIGINPFYIGFTAAVSVGLINFTLISLFGSFIAI